MSMQLYRKSKLGETLEETLIELRSQNKINDSIMNKTLEAFDKCMTEEIPKKYKAKGTIKSKVTSFKNCDDIWIFFGKNVSLRNDRETISSASLKIVACDAKMYESANNNTNGTYTNADDN